MTHHVKIPWVRLVLLAAATPHGGCAVDLESLGAVRVEVTGVPAAAQAVEVSLWGSEGNAPLLLWRSLPIPQGGAPEPLVVSFEAVRPGAWGAGALALGDGRRLAAGSALAVKAIAGRRAVARVVLVPGGTDDACAGAPDAAPCDDALACNGADACRRGRCLARGAPLAAGERCDDANPCNGAETCDGAGACLAGTPLAGWAACDDGDPATCCDVCRGGACDGGSCAPERFIYWTGGASSDDVAVLDVATDTLIDVVAVGRMPDNVAFAPDGCTAWVSESGDDTVAVIDTRTRAVIARVPVGDEPQGLAFTPDGGRVYVANNGSHSVSVIDPAARAVVDTWVRGDPRPTGTTAVAHRPGGAELWVGGDCHDCITVQRLPGGEREGTVEGVIGGATRIVFGGGSAFVANGCGDCGNVQRVRGQDGYPVTATFYLGKGAYDVAVSPRDGVVWASGAVAPPGGRNTTGLLVLAPDDLSLVARLPPVPDVGSVRGLVFGPDGRSLYAAAVLHADATGGVVPRGELWRIDAARVQVTAVVDGAGLRQYAALSPCRAVTQRGAVLDARALGGALRDEARGVAVDGRGYVTVVGEMRWTVELGGGAAHSAGDADVFVTRHAPSGAHAWLRRFGGAGRDAGDAVAVDHEGNAVIAGTSAGGADLGCGALGAGRFVAKLDASGTCLWSVPAGGVGGEADDGPLVVAVDEDGGVLVAGAFEGTVDLGGDALASAGGTDAFVAKLGADGRHVWSRRFGCAGADERVTAVAANDAGDVFVAGRAGGAACPVNLGGGDVTHGFVARLSGAGGDHVWSRGFTGPDGPDDGGAPDAIAVAPAPGRDLVVAGRFRGSIDLGGVVWRARGAAEIFVARYAVADNTYGWSQTFADPSDAQGGLAIAVAPGGDVVLAGALRAPVDFSGQAAEPLAVAGASDAFAVGFASGGAHRWSRRLGGAGDDAAHAVAVDGCGHALLVGAFEGPADLGRGRADGGGGADAFVVRIGP